MRLNSRLQITLSLFTLLLMSAGAMAGQDNLEESLLDDTQVLVNIDFKVTEQYSGLSETAGTKKQMVAEYDEWQEVAVDKYLVKYKISEVQSDETVKQFMIETEILNANEESLHTPTLITKADAAAVIKISGDDINVPEFNLSFEVLSK